MKTQNQQNNKPRKQEILVPSNSTFQESKNFALLVSVFVGFLISRKQMP